MDMSQFNGAAFLKVADVEASGPFTAVIVDIEMGKFKRPDITLDDGTKLAVNVTNNKVLYRHFGADSNDWIGKEIKISVGETEFEGEMQKTIIIQPVSAALEKKAPPKPRSKKGSDMDDEIPF